MGPAEIAIEIFIRWGPWGLMAFLLWYVYAHDEKLDRWIARIEKFLLWLGLKRDKRFIAKDLQSKINSASLKMNKEVQGVITKKINIKWANQDNIESFLRKGKIIIRMRHHDNQDTNTVNALIHYTQTGVLNTGKKYLPKKTTKAIDLAIIKKILSEENGEGTSLEYFQVNVLKPSLDADDEIKQNYTIMELMEEKGLFTRILLKEIKSLGKKLYPSDASAKIEEESKRFISFLEPFAKHGKQPDIEHWDFISPNIQIGILYVASKHKLDKKGLEPYEKQLIRRIQKGCKRIYVFGRKKDNITAVKNLTKAISKQNKKVTVRLEKYKSILSNEELPAVCAIILID